MNAEEESSSTDAVSSPTDAVSSPTDAISLPASPAQSALESMMKLKYKRRSFGMPTTAIIPATSDHLVLSRMQRLVAIFEKEFWCEMVEMHQRAVRLDETDDNGWYRGVRRITGERWEIKVSGEFLGSLPGLEGLPNDMVTYAEKQAKRDERVQAMMDFSQNLDAGLAFSEWSLIVSQDCQAQTTHTDVPAHNVQFGLVLNAGDGINDTPGTLVVELEDFGPHTVEDLIAGPWIDAPHNLKECLRDINCDWTSQILDVFGPMLHPRNILDVNMTAAENFSVVDSKKARKLQCGDLIVTSGGVAHAGPACRNFRMLMFGAASPTPEKLYDVDDQFFAHSTMLYVMQGVWDYVDGESKSWLLLRLAQTALEYDASIADRHESQSPLLTDFMNAVSGLGCVNEQEVVDVVQDFLKQHGAKLQRELFQVPLSALQKVAISV